MMSDTDSTDFVTPSTSTSTTSVSLPSEGNAIENEEASSSLLLFISHSGEDAEEATNSPQALTSTTTTTVTRDTIKCVKCHKRLAREGCTQTACLHCCDDVDGCISHQKPRAQAHFKGQILSGTTFVQLEAAAKRKLQLRAPSKGKFFFREPGFKYQGDTVVIWDVRAYAQNPRWKEDAIRKAVRRQKATNNHKDWEILPPLRNSRKRFHHLVEQWYQTSLTAEQKDSSGSISRRAN